MKKMVENFGNDFLSRNEMKSISGGLCQVCSSGTNGGACGSASFTQAEAQSMVNDFNQLGDGYTYFRSCAEQ